MSPRLAAYEAIIDIGKCRNPRRKDGLLLRQYEIDADFLFGFILPLQQLKCSNVTESFQESLGVALNSLGVNSIFHWAQVV